MANPLNPWRTIVGQEDVVTATTEVAVAHGLPATPTFVLANSSIGTAVTFTADATTLTLTGLSATTSESISYLASVE